MNILIKNVLDSLGITNFFIMKDKKFEGEHVVYNYTSSPSYYADNRKKGDNYTILLNVHLIKNIEVTKKKIIKAMNENGIKGGRVEATLKESNGYLNTAITFKAFKREE